MKGFLTLEKIHLRGIAIAAEVLVIPRAAIFRKETAQEEMLVLSPMKGFPMLLRPQTEPVGDPVRMLSQLERGSRASLLR
jgi:hypothetical protein